MMGDTSDSGGGPSIEMPVYFDLSSFVFGVTLGALFTALVVILVITVETG